MTTRQTRGGFSLIELIVVIGLMALLSTISIGGYFAASRGMEARGVVQDTVSIIRQTMQTCLIDQTPTAILFCNRRQNTRAEEGEAQGIAIAIKMVGRISYIASKGKTSTGASLPVGGGMLVDEFADWNQTYPLDASGSGKQRAIRLYQMKKAGDGVKACSSLMCAWAGYVQLETEYMINARKTVEPWCSVNQKRASDNKSFSGIGYNNGNDQRWGLPFHPENNGLTRGAWSVGDAYGVEIARLELPKGYIFGTSVPSGPELVAASGNRAAEFRPNDITDPSSYQFSFKTLQITRLNDVDGTDTELVGTITRSDLRDQD